MSGDIMTFPQSWEEYEETYGFTDTEQIYTNSIRLIPTFRVQQWLDHLQNNIIEGHWIWEDDYEEDATCSQCGRYVYEASDFRYCPYCSSING